MLTALVKGLRSILNAACACAVCEARPPGMAPCHRWLAFLLALQLLLACAPPGAAASSIFVNRVAVNPCTLVGTDRCRIESLLGRASSQDSFQGAYVVFGEQDCVLHLRGCRPGACYSFRDVSASQAPPRDAAAAALAPAPGTGGVFTSIEAINGTTSARLAGDGFAFRPSGSELFLRYSTHSCASFYAERSSALQQLCDAATEAVTAVDTASLLELGC